MQTLLVTGPGGAGSSTVAAATALRLTAAGTRCVLMTSRPPRPAGLADALRLDVVTPQPALEQLWNRHAQALAAAAHHSAFNLANALGPWLGGLAITAGWGLPSIGWIGTALSVAGLGVLLLTLALHQRQRAAVAIAA